MLLLIIAYNRAHMQLPTVNIFDITVMNQKQPRSIFLKVCNIHLNI